MDPNLLRIKRVVRGLGPLCERMVFVGGSVTLIYATDNAATEIRPTLDVDCITDVPSYESFERLETELRQRGFINDLESGVICRWKYGLDTIDIVPANQNILGFSNKWYSKGISKKISYKIEPDTQIFILPVNIYLACKIEALKSRGGTDWRTSHDFEDIVFILNYNKDIVKNFQSENDDDLKCYLKHWAAETLIRQNITEEIECVLPYGEADRTYYILNILRIFSK